MATTHQAKRPYAGSHSQPAQTPPPPHHQSTITTYFHSTTANASAFTSFSSSSQPTHPIRNGGTYTYTTSLLASSPSSSSNIPLLPALVQSNLLSVGMRVRKSVPEGYKTRGGGEGEGLRARKQAPFPPVHFPSSSSSSSPSSPASHNGGTVPARGPAYHAARRELAPFCGILKVGGLAVQGWGSDLEGEGGEEGDEEGEEEQQEGVPSLVSSQGSMASTVSTLSTLSDGHSRTGHKRRFEEAEEAGGEIAHDDYHHASGAAAGEAPACSIWRDVSDDGDDDGEVQLSPKTRLVDLPPRRFGLGLGSASVAARRARAVPVPKLKSRREGGVVGTVGAGFWNKSAAAAGMEGQENDNRYYQHRHLGGIGGGGGGDGGGDGVAAEVDFGEAEFMDWSSCLG